MEIHLPIAPGCTVTPTSISPCCRYLAMTMNSGSQSLMDSNAVAGTACVISVESRTIILKVPPAPAFNFISSCAPELTFSASDKAAVLIRQLDTDGFGGVDELQIHCLVSRQQLCTFSMPDGCSHMGFVPGNDNFIAFL